MSDSTNDERIETLKGLDRAFPNGWRSGDETTDAMTFLLARGLRQMLSAMFPQRGRPS